MDVFSECEVNYVVSKAKLFIIKTAFNKLAFSKLAFSKVAFNKLAFKRYRYYLTVKELRTKVGAFIKRDNIFIGFLYRGRCEAEIIDFKELKSK